MEEVDVQSASGKDSLDDPKNPDAWEKEVSRVGKGGTYLYSDGSLLEGGNVGGGGGRVSDGEAAGMAEGLGYGREGTKRSSVSRTRKQPSLQSKHCIVLYLLPVLNPKSYEGARVLEASGRLMLVIGRSKRFVIQWLGDDAGTKSTGIN